MASANHARRLAKTQGLKIFESSRPCPKGHMGPRRVSNGSCAICDTDRALATYYANKAEWLTQGKVYYKANVEKCKAVRAAYRLAHPEVHISLRQKHKAKYAAATKRWRNKNKGRNLALEAKRRAAKLKRTPKWADLVAISKVYEQCPKSFTVDHIIPLQGKLVSGLHVHNNLQYLTRSDNSKKLNRYEVE